MQVGGPPLFVVHFSSTPKSDLVPVGYPVTVIPTRPSRSFQPPMPFVTTPPPPPYWSQQSPPRSTLPISTTAVWYSNWNVSSPQMSTRSNYDLFSRSTDTHVKTPTDVPYRSYNNENMGRDWTSQGRQFTDSNIPSWNNWNGNAGMGGQREGYSNTQWTRTSDSYPYQRPELSSRNYFNVTNRPSDYRGDWNHQNVRQNWNWEGRYRSSMGFPYRPYQNTPNYRQPIALPPIQLPPLYSEVSRPLQGASVVGRPHLVREGTSFTEFSFAPVLCLCV